MEHRWNDTMALVTPLTAHATAVGDHPAGSGRRERPRSETPRHPGPGFPPIDAEDGSLVTEYGLLAIVAATLAGAVISWASNGAMVTLFNALLRQARALVGA
jgi:hypothetical protein